MDAAITWRRFAKLSDSLASVIVVLVLLGKDDADLEVERLQLEAKWLRTRNHLVLNYQPLVIRLANKLAHELPSSVDVNDLISDGTLGLIDAVTKFEVDRGLKFETYAPRRITGAMYDGLRRMDWVPRTVRARLRMVQAATGDLTSTLARPPTEDEIADYLGWDLGELRSTLENHQAQGIARLDEPVNGGQSPGEESLSLADILTDTTSRNGTDMEMEVLRERLTGALSELPAREATVLTLFYHEHLKFAEIGDRLGVSESWICQIHMNAIEQIRSNLLEGSVA